MTTARRRSGDVNGIVAYNVAAIWERQGWTRPQLVQRIRGLVRAGAGGGAGDDQAAEEMLRRIDGLADPSRRHRFDAHDLYVLSMAFDVPIAYFFLPPPAGEVPDVLADTGRPTVTLYGAFLGHSRQMGPLDERLREVDVAPRGDTGRVLAALFGFTHGARTWPEHYREWREDRLHQLAEDHGASLRAAAGFIARLAQELTDAGGAGALAHVEAQAACASSGEANRSSLP